MSHTTHPRTTSSGQPHTTMPNPETTREALLVAARSLFAQRGYDGTSIRALTAAAGANLGAVTYHFGSKEELYRAVLLDVLGPLPDLIRQAARSDGSPLDRVDRIVRTYLRFFADHPDVPRFMLQEIAQGKTPPPPVIEVIGDVARTIAATLHEGQRAGAIRQGDPLFLTLSLISQPVYFALVRRAFSHVAGRDPLAGDSLAAVEEHVAAIARAGLAAPAPEDQPRAYHRRTNDLPVTDPQGDSR